MLKLSMNFKFIKPQKKKIQKKSKKMHNLVLQSYKQTFK